MTWSTPPVFVPLQTLTASVMNELSDRLTDLHTLQGVRCSHSGGTQAIGDSSYTALSWDQVDWDTDAFWAIGNPTRITIPVAGYYEIEYTVNFTASAGNSRLSRIYKNGAWLYGFDDARFGLTGVGTVLHATGKREFAVSDYLEVKVWQNTGGNLDVSMTQSMFWATFIGE